MERIYERGIWRFERIGDSNRYKVTIKIEPCCITMTGADVTTEMEIPFAHRWVRTHFKHMTALYAEATGEMDILIRRKLGAQKPQYYDEDVVRITGTTAVRRTDKWAEGFEYEPTVYQILLNSTATDVVLPVFYLQHQGES
jgi:hypothetical protein